MAETATIHALFETNASDIPAMLRQAADAIETEEAEGFDPTRAMVAVQIGKGGDVRVYGWGRTDSYDSYDSYDSMGILQCGIAQLANNLTARD